MKAPALDLDGLLRLRSLLWQSAASMRRDLPRAWPWVVRARELAGDGFGDAYLGDDLDRLIRLVESGPTSDALILLDEIGSRVDALLGEMETAA